MKSLLIVHSSAELYGSDRSLLDFVRAQHGFSVDVVLPEDGPLVGLLRDAGANVVVGEVCKIQRSMFTPCGLVRAAFAAWTSLQLLRGIAGPRKYDLVYSNTVAILGGCLYSVFNRVPHVWHVREILQSSKFLTGTFRFIVGRLSKRIICNSNQTKAWIGTEQSNSKSIVVWNGVSVAEPKGVRTAERQRLGYAESDVVFALAGRINAWKGQSLLIDAFDQLRSSGVTGAKLWIVGSAFSGQEHFEQALAERVAASPYREDITVEAFRPDVEAVWEAADVVTVPSTEPEPFGRVAIEAMAFGRPVVAAAHGGLLDIVDDGVSGLLFAPRDAEALSLAMRRLIDVPDLRANLGRAACERQRLVFSVEAYAEKVTKVLRDSLVAQ